MLLTGATYVVLPDADVDTLDLISFEVAFSHSSVSAQDTLLVTVVLTNQFDQDVWLSPSLELFADIPAQEHDSIEDEVLAITLRSIPIRPITRSRSDCRALVEYGDHWCVVEAGESLELRSTVAWDQLEVPEWPYELPIEVRLQFEGLPGSQKGPRGQSLVVGRESIWVE